MQKYEVKEALDRINEMSDNEIAINAKFIREVALAAYGLIKSLDKPKRK